MLPVYGDGDRIIISPGANTRGGEDNRGLVMAKQLARLTMRPVELQSFNPQFENRVLELTDVAFTGQVSNQNTPNGRFFSGSKELRKEIKRSDGNQRGAQDDREPYGFSAAQLAPEAAFFGYIVFSSLGHNVLHALVNFA
jgi:hypothetical protein